ncbi:MAG: phosphoribosylformylglycinamidine synthase subunit PurL [Candidatus Kapabacteria bacterium]|nr:phosphoribosylformylglycinamidine synthase subunit PurL [Ignavibacteriota bacterium]MCW5884950.1 phosphoribosylformylglycinamidine synthase subunit PurL [Candidatus Kapabacteria bacterium]
MSNENQLYSEIEVTVETARELGLTEAEYQRILEILGRTPTYTELGVYSVMWSEHCSYKNSIKQLKTLPRSGNRLLVEAGEENAGLVDIGDGYAIAFKIESHNHPSAIEPFQGAATGVGGILRDIFTMGARPIAALNSLRFGELSSPRTQFLLSGVVHGISHYGNCFGVPTVGGEIYFDSCYHDNPLVNAMAVGIVKVDKTASAASAGVGNPVMILGSSTGRDGIHGASLLASREFDEKTEDMRPTVQVGDPFAEKLLLEATLELIDAGTIAGIQDMGAAGISCSTSEMSAKNGLGMIVDLDKVPLRESDMSAYEIMLSESQERMLAVIHHNKVEKAIEICNKWDVPITQIGNVTDDGILHITRNGKKVVELEADYLVLGGGAPQYDREFKEPEYLKITRSYDTKSVSEMKPDVCDFKEIIKSPTIASKKWIFEQYDSQVRTNTVNIKGDAAVIRIKEIPGKAIAVKTDCNSRFTYLDPYTGGMAAVAEAARNVVCVGAEPVAITNCLNFGNPYDPEVFWQFREAVRGMGDACRRLNTPVTGGNVSFHNESKNFAVYPTPTIGMLGIIESLDDIMTYEFKKEGDIIALVGFENCEVGGSEYLKLYAGEVTGNAPQLNIENELSLQKVILAAIKSKLINSAHDISEGGLGICLAEKAIAGNIGCTVNLSDLTVGRIFGESQSRVVVTLDKSNQVELSKICEANNVPVEIIGQVGGEFVSIEGYTKLSLDEIKNLYENAIPNLMNK